MELTFKPATLSKIVRNRATEPNPFLDEGILEQTYTTGQALECSVPGKWESRQKMTKKREKVFAEDGVTPVMHDVLTGEAHNVTYQLHTAARMLGIGVRIEYDKGAKRGEVTVRFLGQKRRERKANANGNGTDPDTENTDGSGPDTI